MSHILIVDDSLTETHLLKHSLEKHGYQVSEACDGREGVDVALIEQPDLIIMDIVMPVLNGFQATRELTQHKKTSEIPVIIYSAKNQTVDKLWAKRQGALDYWVKPLPERDLIESLQTYIK